MFWNLWKNKKSYNKRKSNNKKKYDNKRNLFKRGKTFQLPHNAEWNSDRKYYNTLISRINSGEYLKDYEYNWLENNGHRFDE